MSRRATLRLIAAVFALFAPAAAAAQGDPPIPAIAIGDLITPRRQPIAIVGQDVTVRPERVEVRYRFANPTDATIDAPVILPIPDIGPEIMATNAGGPRADPANFIDLAVTVDGAPVELTVVQRAIVGGRDVTETLRREQVPISFFARGLVPTLTGRSLTTRRTLAAAGIATFGELGGYEIRWTMRSWFTWTQSFGPRRAIDVTLRYRPLAGDFAADARELALPAAEQARCLDAPARAAFAAGRAPPELSARGIRIGLALGGTTNWAGAPAIFGLTIDAGDPALVAAACMAGLNRSGPGRLDARIENFAPDRPVVAFFLPVRAPARAGRSAEAADPRFPEGSLIRLTQTRVFGYPPEDLRAMRAAMLARAGSEEALTATERNNIAVIAARLRDLGASP
ncbi:MAG: DUF4424 family protein [Alphaproteobacteria bacterium]|nr:DUF4424 family protein [Alphaproteobacteria bacterium]